MKKTACLFAFLVSLLCLASCAGTPKGKVTKCEPVENDSVFLCGVVTYEGLGHGSYRGEVSVDGLYTKGIELKIKDINTGKVYNVKTEKHGFFYIPKAKAGHKYQLIEATVRDENDGYGTWVTFPLTQTRICTCKVKQGTILCNVRISYKDKFFTWNDPGESYRVRQVFRLLYPESGWNNYEFAYSF